MQVDTLGKYLGGDDNLVVILPLALVVGIEVLLNLLLHLIAIGCGDSQHLVLESFVFTDTLQCIDRIDCL